MKQEVYCCDYCGKECEHTDYILPVIEIDTEYAKDGYGNKLAKLNIDKVVPRQVDICPECQETIARLTRIMKYADVKVIEDNLVDAFVNSISK